jgi:hypothetical protein
MTPYILIAIIWGGGGVTSFTTPFNDEPACLEAAAKIEKALPWSASSALVCTPTTTVSPQ